MCSLRLVPKENHRILESYQDFILSRQAALLSPSTIEFYKRTVGELISFLSEREIYEPEGITSALVRGYFPSVSERGVASATVHAHARGTRAFLRFLHEEGYITAPINITMPRVEQKKMRVLSPDELSLILKACKKPRDKALIIFLVDSGMRRSEALSLNWIDVDIPSGAVNIRRSKSKKARSVFIGVKTRCALLRYRRTISHEGIDPVFQTQSGTRLKPSGFREVIRRTSEKSEVPFSAHDRTVATLSWFPRMNILHLMM